MGMLSNRTTTTRFSKHETPFHLHWPTVSEHQSVAKLRMWGVRMHSSVNNESIVETNANIENNTNIIFVLLLRIEHAFFTSGCREINVFSCDQFTMRCVIFAVTRGWHKTIVAWARSDNIVDVIFWLGSRIVCIDITHRNRTLITFLPLCPRSRAFDIFDIDKIIK